MEVFLFRYEILRFPFALLASYFAPPKKKRKNSVFETSILYFKGVGPEGRVHFRARFRIHEVPLMFQLHQIIDYPS